MPVPDTIYDFGCKLCYLWGGGLHDRDCVVFEDDTGLRCSFVHYKV